MKKYLFPLLCVLIFTCSCQTSSSIGSDPVADGQEIPISTGLRDMQGEELGRDR
ncbi:hypothetical protein [uncultured Duncaniella sp.]|uniref:hypothetical protein n=1 Tax=uncultured Duncaniella sp. TaxID=2768039 RepID=UPI0025A990C4|nr:hypothetical protein [uncultured Duncaniella sp.]